MRITSYNSDINLEDIESLQIIVKAVPFEETFVPAFVIMSPDDKYPMSIEELNALMDGIEIARNKIDEVITYILRKKIINDEFEEVLDDDEINFIVIDGKKMRKKNHKIKNDPKIQEIIDYLIKNNSESYQANQQRNLDRETGGTELPKTFTTSSIDVWDNRGEEIEEMAEIKPQDYNSDDKASMIWEKKRKKKQQNDHENSASNSFENSSNKSRSGIFNSSTSKKSRHL
jgi:hypothetical protein